jgi:multiple sugar transport system permease protein/N-acetylglucosamine transport system permease protein
MEARKKRNKSLNRSKRSAILFYCAMLAWPVLQFCVFYAGVNFNSFLLAFQEWDSVSGRFVFGGTRQFDVIWTYLTNTTVFSVTFKNSVIALLTVLFISMPLALLFSFYISRKKFGSGFFKLVLFLPSIISSIVLTIIFVYFVEKAIPYTQYLLTGAPHSETLFSNAATRFPTILFYNVWVGFGTSILLYSGAIGRVPGAVLEAARIDGIRPSGEFFRIVLPMIFPTISTMLLIHVAALFTSQLNLYNFYGSGADLSLQTVGYYLFRETVIANNTGYASYPYPAALGVCLTLILVPVTLLLRFALSKVRYSDVQY